MEQQHRAAMGVVVSSIFNGAPDGVFGVFALAYLQRMLKWGIPFPGVLGTYKPYICTIFFEQ